MESIDGEERRIKKHAGVERAVTCDGGSKQCSVVGHIFTRDIGNVLSSVYGFVS